MVDPRYDNVEIYHSTEFGLELKGILAGSEVLTEKLVPEFQFVIAELFATPKPQPDSRIICLNGRVGLSCLNLETRNPNNL